MLDASLFGEGQRPALDLGLSVSRVGTKVQWPIVKELSGPLRLEFLQFRELQRIAKLRSGSQTEDVAQRLKSGEILLELLKQDKDTPVKLEALVLILYAFHKKYLHRLEIEEVRKFQVAILPYAEKKDPEFLKLLRERRKKDEQIEKGLEAIISVYVEEVEKGRSNAGGQTSEDESIVSNIGRDVLNEATSKKKA